MPGGLEVGTGKSILSVSTREDTVMSVEQTENQEGQDIQPVLAVGPVNCPIVPATTITSSIVESLTNASTPDKTPILNMSPPQQESREKSVCSQSAKSAVGSEASELGREPSALQAVVPFMDYKDLPIEVPLIDISKSAELKHFERLKTDNLSDDLSISCHSSILDLQSSGQSQLPSTQKSAVNTGTPIFSRAITLTHVSAFNPDSPGEVFLPSPASETSSTSGRISVTPAGKFN